MRVLGPHCKQAADDAIPKTGPFGYLSFIGQRFFMTTLSALVIHETGAERPAREGQFSRLPVCSSVPPASYRAGRRATEVFCQQQCQYFAADLQLNH
jgi:hypothetical protein